MGKPEFLTEFILSGKSKILPAAQNDSEGLEMTKWCFLTFYETIIFRKYEKQA